MSLRTLLSSEQRARLFGIPTDAAGMAKYYVLRPLLGRRFADRLS